MYSFFFPQHMHVQLHQGQHNRAFICHRNLAQRATGVAAGGTFLVP